MYTDLGVVLNENVLINTIKDEIGDILFFKFSNDFYYNIIHNKSLYLFSSFYPTISPPILLTTSEHGIKSINPFNGETCVYKYEVPNFNPREIQYVGVFKGYFSHNTMNNYTPLGNGTVGSMLHKLLAQTPHAMEPYQATFEAPNIAVVNPIPSHEVIESFTVKMKIKKKLNQIEFGQHEDFKNLVLCDVKISIMNKFPNLRDSGVYSGVEINTRIGDFQDAVNQRKELIEIFENDWYKSAEMFEAFGEYSY